MKKLWGINIFFLCALGLCQVSYAQSPVEGWVASYNNPQNLDDELIDLILDSKGNIYVAGEMAEDMLQRNNILIIKYDSNKNVLWTKTLNGGDYQDDQPIKMAIDSQDNLILLSSSYGLSEPYHILISKYDQEGNELWSISDNNYHALDMVLDTNDYIYITGYVSAPPGTDYITLKYTSNGDKLWATTYEGSYRTGKATAIEVDIDGNVYVTGTSDEGNFINNDWATVKYSSDGHQLWVARHGDLADTGEFPVDLALDSLGNLYVTGFSKKDFLTIKYDPNIGIPLWTRSFDRSGYSDIPVKMAIDSEDNIFVSGNSRADAADNDYTTIRYNSNGDTLWESHFNYPRRTGNPDYLTSMDLNKDSIYVTGYSFLTGNVYDFVTIKYDKIDGDELWRMEYNSSYNQSDLPVEIAVDQEENVYVAGQTVTVLQGENLTTVKYVQYPKISGLTDILTPIVPQGDWIQYKATFINNTVEPQIFQYWAKAKLPDGEWLENYVISPESIQLGPYEIFSKTQQSRIPVKTPIGEWEIWGYLGPNENSVWDNDSGYVTITDK